ncbi:MAG: hypothetical protein HY904_11075 [Deltaproteobacteria bacterium]|nr:hypothetical protein [Deltaproteobacteria bacterium]
MRRLPPLAALWLLGALPAWASPEVEAGKAAFLRGDLRPALAKLDEAARSPSVTEEELVDIHWFRGACYHALGKRDLSEKEFDALLAVRPLFTPNKLETPPDVRAAFKKRADHYLKAHGVTFGPPRLQGTALEVTLAGAVAEAREAFVFARAPGDVRYVQFPLALEGPKAQGELADAALWERAGAAGSLQVVLEARNRRGTPVARGGDAVQPLSLAVTPEAARVALDALKAKAQPAPEPAPPVQPLAAADGNPPAPAAAGSPARTPLLVAGLGLLGVSSLTGLAALAGAVGAAACGVLFAVTSWQYGQFGADHQRSSLERRWWVGQVGMSGAAAVAVVAAVVTLAVGAPGMGLLIARGALG